MNFTLIFIELFEYFLPFRINQIANFRIELNEFWTNSNLTPPLMSSWSQIRNVLIMLENCLDWFNILVGQDHSVKKYSKAWFSIWIFLRKALIAAGLVVLLKNYIILWFFVRRGRHWKYFLYCFLMNSVQWTAWKCTHFSIDWNVADY